MYAGRAACCHPVSHSEYAYETDRRTNRRTDARPLHYAFRNKNMKRDIGAYVCWQTVLTRGESTSKLRSYRFAFSTSLCEQSTEPTPTQTYAIIRGFLNVKIKNESKKQTIKVS